MIAHVGGMPLEEFLPSVTGAGAALLLEGKNGSDGGIAHEPG